MMRPPRKNLWLFTFLLAVGCGDDKKQGAPGTISDGGMTSTDGSMTNSDASTDANTNPGFGLECGDFTEAAVTTLNIYPATFGGDINGSGADLAVAEGQCTTERGFFSQEGEDSVISLEDLTPGTPYTVLITATEADISFYVAGSCEDGNPDPLDCSLFVDSGTNQETGTFTAPASGQAYLVIDQYGVMPVTDGTYRLDINEAECADDAQCTNGEVCLNGLCVECTTAANCTDSAAPLCDTESNICIASFDACVGDDPSPPEGADDGPSGATQMTITEATPSVHMARICSNPTTESDYYTFNVASAGARSLKLEWLDAGADLDFRIFDSAGNFVNSATSTRNPEVLVTEYTPGDYYLSVFKYAADGVGDTVSMPYTLTGAIPECLQTLDCTTPTSPVCSPAGACVAGPNDCVGDDVGESSNDDGPAGANIITTMVGGAASTVNANICNAPSSEVDFYKVAVDSGDSLMISLSWTNADPMNVVDLDITARSSDLTPLGFSYWLNPETVEITNLPAGDVFLQVAQFGNVPTTAVTPYTLSVTQSSGGCSVDADCDDSYQTQIYRGRCESSACVSIEGSASLADGAACDSSDDCMSGLCSYITFESDASESVCTNSCNAQSPTCPAGQKCFIEAEACVPDCSLDTDCGADLESSSVDTGLSWDYLSCDVSTSTCSLPPLP